MKTKIDILPAPSSTSRDFFGDAGLCEIARMADADMVLVAIVGTGGLPPALAGVQAGKDLARSDARKILGHGR